MKAVHFGAGNIGRGFIGLLLETSGYEVLFADVNAPLIEALQNAGEYRVREVGEGGQTHVVNGFRAINSAAEPEALTAEIASADVVTTAVGPNILKFVAPSIVAGLKARSPEQAPLVVMACENAVGATDILKGEIEKAAGDDWAGIASRAVYANTAVDRIVPAQTPENGVDVMVEPFCEWVVEAPSLGANVPDIAGAHFVDDLVPYIERKLFTVNTGHASAAYFGFLEGAESIADALANPSVEERVRAVLEETSAYLVSKHGLDDEAQTAYREKILGRFRNPELPDTVARVGREPLRKLSRHERFIGPAAEIADAGTTPVALLSAIGAALRFDVPEDPQSVELRGLLASAESPAEFVGQVSDIEAGHPLFDPLVDVVADARTEITVD